MTPARPVESFFEEMGRFISDGRAGLRLDAPASLRLAGAACARWSRWESTPCRWCSSPPCSPAWCWPSRPSRCSSRFNAESFVGSLVALSMVRELSAVLSGLIVAGRAGSAMGAELGTMRVTEQIDALEVMATDPVHYLVVPRVWASTIMLPLLVVLGNGVGIFGGYLVAVWLMGANPVAYLDRTFQFMDLNDLFSGAHQGRGLRLPPGRHRLPAGLLHLRRRRGRGPRHHRRRGGGEHRDPDLGFLPDEAAVLMAPSASPQDPADCKIRIRGLRKSFGPKLVLDGVDLDVAPAESLVIIGGSGTGKSVLLKHIIGLLQAGCRHGRGGRRRRRDARQPGDHRVPAQVRHGLPGGRPVRLHDGLAERGVPLTAPHQDVALARSTTGWRSAWPWCGSKGSERSSPRSSRAACGAGWASPAAWPTARRSSFSTSPPPVSIR